MISDIKPLGEQSFDEILAKLEEIEGPESARSFAGEEKAERLGLEGVRSRKPWLNTQHQYGFVPRFTPGAERHHKIVSASNIHADETLKSKRINIKLDYLHVHSYPTPLINLGTNIHTILFSFEARNQVQGNSEAVAFNQTYEARSGQDAAVTGYPIFIGLTASPNGVAFSCRTVNVNNSTDQQLVKAINSETVTAGLSLLTTTQPALAPFVDVARALCVSLANHSKNAPVQKFVLGLDFDTGTAGARLAVGNYVVAQVARADEINWSDWKFDSETGTVVRINLAEGETPYSLPYNAIVFRVSPYAE